MDNDLGSRSGGTHISIKLVENSMVLVTGYPDTEVQFQKFGHILNFVQQCLDLIRLFQVRFEDCRRVGAGKALSDCEAA